MTRTAWTTFRTAARPASFATVALAIASASSVAASEFDITVTTVADGTLHGRLVEFTLAAGLVMELDTADGQYRAPAADVVDILATPRPVRSPADLTRLELVNGDRLAGRLVEPGTEAVRLETLTIGELEIPLDRVRTVLPYGTAQPVHRAAVAAFLKQPRPDDALLLSNGDVAHGFLTAVGPRGYSLATDAGESHLARSAVIAASLASGPPPPDDGLRVRVLTVDDQLLTARRCEWAGFTALAELFDGTDVHIPGDRIARLEVLGGRWQWLAGLDPISYEHTPALSVSWQWVPDANVLGGPMRVAGRTFEHGLGVHSESSLTFDLGKEYREFRTAMGLDDDSGPYANVDVEIRIDGQLRHSASGIIPGQVHGPIRLDVTGAKRVELTVLFGANADLQDRFNWIEPALIR